MSNETLPTGDNDDVVAPEASTPDAFSVEKALRDCHEKGTLPRHEFLKNCVEVGTKALQEREQAATEGREPMSQL